MAQKQEDDFEIDPESITEEEDLLVTFFSGFRIFTLNNVNSTTVLGVVMTETDDSFLVALPSRLTEQAEHHPDGSVIVTGPPVVVPLSSEAYLRLMKNAVLGVSHMYGIFREKYLEYINTEGKKLYPEVFEYLDEEDSSTQQAKDKDDFVEVTDEDVLEISLNRDSGTTQKALGMTDEELKEYLEKKYNIGDLLGDGGKKH